MTARPTLMITLGAETAGLLCGVRSQEQRNALLGQEPSNVKVGEVEALTVHLAHPGIVMRKGGDEGRNPWPKRHTDEHIPALRRWLAGRNAL
jgi:hypothetical protein